MKNEEEEEINLSIYTYQSDNKKKRKRLKTPVIRDTICHEIETYLLEEEKAYRRFARRTMTIIVAFQGRTNFLHSFLIVDRKQVKKSDRLINKYFFQRRRRIRIVFHCCTQLFLLLLIETLGSEERRIPSIFIGNGIRANCNNCRNAFTTDSR